jgi:hypothetical protein
MPWRPARIYNRDRGHAAVAPTFDPGTHDRAAAERMIATWREDEAAGRAPCYCADCRGER